MHRSAQYCNTRESGMDTGIDFIARLTTLQYALYVLSCFQSSLHIGIFFCDCSIRVIQCSVLCLQLGFVQLLVIFVIVLKSQSCYLGSCTFYYRVDLTSAVNLILKSKPVNWKAVTGRLPVNWILCTSTTSIANNVCFNINVRLNIYTGAPKIHCEYLKLKIKMVY